MNVLITHGWSEENAGDYAIEESIMHVINDLSSVDNKFTFLSLFDKSDSRLLSNNEFKLALENVELLPSLWATPPFGISFIYKVFYILKKSVYSLFILLFLKIQKVLFRKITFPTKSLEIFNEIDFVVVKGGAFIYTPTGLKGIVFVARILFPIIIAILFNRKIIVAPHSFGPFDNFIGNYFVKKTLRHINLILCRENDSIKSLSEMGLRNLAYCPDLAFYENGISNKALKDNSNELNIGLTVRPWEYLNSKKSKEIYKKYICALADSLIEQNLSSEKMIVFHLIPQVIGPDNREDDSKAINDLIKKIKSSTNELRIRVYERKKRRPSELISIYSNLDILIGTRMHSVIFALLSGIPAVAISYLGPKHIGIMKEFGLEKFVLKMEGLRSSDITLLVEELITDREKISTKIISGVDKSKNEILKIFTKFTKELNS